MFISVLKSKIDSLHKLGVSEMTINELEGIVESMLKEIAINNFTSVASQISILKGKLYRLYTLDIQKNCVQELLNITDSIKKEIMLNGNILPTINIDNTELSLRYTRGLFNVLVADDCQDSLNWLKVALWHLPLKLDITNNGATAVSKFQDNQYEMVLMDVEMPGINGYMATNLIRSWERENSLNPTPIIALSENPIISTRERSLLAGCNSHLDKPVKQGALVDAVMKHIHFSMPSNYDIAEG